MRKDLQKKFLIVITMVVFLLLLIKPKGNRLPFAAAPSKSYLSPFSKFPKGN